MDDGGGDGTGCFVIKTNGVTRGRGQTAQGDTLHGVTPERKKFVGLKRIVDKRGRTGKKGAG